MNPLTNSHSRIAELTLSADKDLSSGSSEALPRQTALTFEAAISDHLAALLTGSSPSKIPASHPPFSTPASVVTALIARGSVTQEQESLVNQSILNHPTPLPLLSQINELLAEEARRSQVLQQIEQQHSLCNIPPSPELRELAVVATPESGKEFDRAVTLYLNHIAELTAPSSVDLGRQILGEIRNGTLSMNDDHATFMSWYVGTYFRPAQPQMHSFTATAVLDTAVAQGWLSENERPDIQASLLSSNEPLITWHALYGFKLLQDEFARRKNLINQLVTLAEDAALTLPHNILDAIVRIPCRNYDFDTMFSDFKKDAIAVQSLRSPAITRWIPQSELEAVSQLPEDARVARAYEIVQECRTLQRLDEIDSIRLTMQENIISLTTSSGPTYIERGKVLNTRKDELLKKLATFDISCACSASVRPDLLALVSELGTLSEAITSAVHSKEMEEWKKHQAELEWRSQFNPM